MIILMVPVVSWRLACSETKPTLAERLRARQRWRSGRGGAPAPRTPSARRARRSVRSGYAFAHQEGFGRLITSGKIMKISRITHADAALSALASLPGKFQQRPSTPPSPSTPPTPPSPRAPKQDLDSVDLWAAWLAVGYDKGRPTLRVPCSGMTTVTPALKMEFDRNSLNSWKSITLLVDCANTFIFRIKVTTKFFVKATGISCFQYT